LVQNEQPGSEITWGGKQNGFYSSEGKGRNVHHQWGRNRAKFRRNNKKGDRKRMIGGGPEKGGGGGGACKKRARKEWDQPPLVKNYRTVGPRISNRHL